jgi:hypothetical protein
MTKYTTSKRICKCKTICISNRYYSTLLYSTQHKLQHQITAQQSRVHESTAKYSIEEYDKAYQQLRLRSAFSLQLLQGILRRQDSDTRGSGTRTRSTEISATASCDHSGEHLVRSWLLHGYGMVIYLVRSWLLHGYGMVILWE